MLSRRWLLTMVLLGGGCAGDGMIDGEGSPDGGAGPDGSGAQSMRVVVVAPAAGTNLGRVYLAGDGKWIARVEFRAEAAGAAFVTWMSGGSVMGIGQPPDFTFRAEFATDGDRTLAAVARGPGGEELGRADVSFTVEGAPAGDCLASLEALGVQFDPGPNEPGVQTPVTIALPLNGIRYHPNSLSAAPRTSWFMDCELALSMWRMGDVFQKAGITDVWDYGIYNYRCIDQSVDPPCPGSKLSLHGQAKAVDVAGVAMASGKTYSVNDDWVIDSVPSGKNACTVAPDHDPENEFLHTLVCDLFAKHVFNILLTPNYNADHRNHFHVDLTDDSYLLHKVEEPGVDPLGHEDH